MKAITLKEPWAWLVINGGKDCENRNWITRFRGRVAIHTSSKPYPAEFSHAQSLIERERLHISMPKPLPQPSDLAYGAIIGTVEIVDCVSRSDSPWFFGDYGFVLRNPIALAEPIPCRGFLNFWDVPPLTLRLIEAQLEKA